MGWLEPGPGNIKFLVRGFHLTNPQRAETWFYSVGGQDLSEGRSAGANRGMEPVTLARNKVIGCKEASRGARKHRREHLPRHVGASACRRPLSGRESPLGVGKVKIGLLRSECKHLKGRVRSQITPKAGGASPA